MKIPNEHPDRVQFPRIHEDLLRKLNELYPEKTPDVDQSMPEIFKAVGQRDVIRRLNTIYKQQTGKDI